MSSYLNPLNTSYIEELENQYRKEPQSIDPSWRYFFDGLTMSRAALATAGGPSPDVALKDLEFEVKVLRLIEGYREMGHLIADVNPLERGTKTHPLLDLSSFGLSEADLDTVCDVGHVLGFGAVPLREIIKALKEYYCSAVAIEYGHIDDPRSRWWLQQRIESNILSEPLPSKDRMRALEKLLQTEVFERFLHKRFVGQKRFSIEGNDVIIPMLDYLIDQAGELGTDEIILGMAHRGRLSVLTNIFEKDLRVMLAEFSGNLEAEAGEGDVKYHMGFSQNTVTFSGKPVHLSLMSNPSHLEAIDSVLMGVTRAKQKLKGDSNRTQTLPVLIHGDASFSGQGSVYEMLNMSGLKGYTVGGTIHIILNNQIGYTTTPKEAHTAPQATDVAKMLDIPIFRVNADEVEDAIRCVNLAIQFRYQFKKDVVIDVVGYRRYGHNEGDEPAYTHPLMYKAINAHTPVGEIYVQELTQARDLDSNELAQKVALIRERMHTRLDEALNEAKQAKVSPAMHAFGDRWKNLIKVTDKNVFKSIKTSVAREHLLILGQQLLEVPAGFQLHPKLKKNLEERREMLSEKRGVDWSLAEALAFASLISDGYAVRLAGQDSERGTFSQRHAVFHDFETGQRFAPLNHINNGGADFEIVNSLLSEYAAMGFEFGQSLASPRKLTLWEAQYGDFINGAQIIVDQFVTSSAVKWQRHSGLILLLPHAYEGQGSEHSSARLERFLQACAQNNIQVCNFTTPAQYFHALRRQMLRDIRLPLIVMTPKSLLRHPQVVSMLSELSHETFHEILDDPEAAPLRETATRIVLCSGKIYYDLLEARKQSKTLTAAILRVEQLYPLNKARMSELLTSYRNATQIVWCQEGPKNMESWNFMSQELPTVLSPQHTLSYVGRPPLASPADAMMHLHIKEQKRIVTAALGES